MQNPNCDGATCRFPSGEVRVLPYGNDGGNMILCRECYVHELTFRKTRNRELSPDCRFPMPTWHSLALYTPAPVCVPSGTRPASLVASNAPASSA